MVFSPTDKPEFHIERRLALYLKLCQDPTLDRTAIHTAAVLLLKHANSKTAKTVPERDTIAEGMGRSEWTVSQGLQTLKVRWLRQVRRVGTSARYEWNWEGVSAQEWQASPTMNVRSSPNNECWDKTQHLNIRSSPNIHIKKNLEEENREGQPLSSTSGDDEEGRESFPSMSGEQGTGTDTDPGAPDPSTLKESNPPTLKGTEPAFNDTGSDDPTDIGFGSPPDCHTAPAHTPENNGTTANTGSVDGSGNNITLADREVFQQIRHLPFPPSTHGHDWDTGLQAFIRLVESGGNPQFILSQAQRYATVRNHKNEPRYTQTITNWLERGGWKKEYPDPNAPTTAPLTGQASYLAGLGLLGRHRKQNLN